MAESEYLVFTETKDTGKTKVWEVRSRHHGDLLGHVSWYGPWRQYTFRPQSGTIWNTGCLNDINDFMSKATEAWRTARRDKGI